MHKEKTIIDLAKDIWRARRFVLGAVTVGVVAAGVFALSAVPHTRAHMLVAPANPMNGAEVSSLLANDNIFALRYLVERVGVTNDSDFARFEMTYKGASVAGTLLKDPKILMGLAQDRAFRFSKAQKEWSPEELSDYIAQRVRLEPMGTTSMRQMVYAHPNPAFAKYFLARIHAQADGLIRATIRDESADRIRYLQDSIAGTHNPEHRRALTTLMLEQERLKMLVSIDQAFAATVVEAPSADVKPSWPDFMLVFPLSAFVCSILGLALFYGFEQRSLLLEMLQDEGRGKKRKPKSAAGWFRSNSNDPGERPLTAKKKAEPVVEAPAKPKAANE